MEINRPSFICNHLERALIFLHILYLECIHVFTCDNHLDKLAYSIHWDVFGISCKSCRLYILVLPVHTALVYVYTLYEIRKARSQRRTLSSIREAKRPHRLHTRIKPEEYLSVWGTYLGLKRAGNM